MTVPRAEQTRRIATLANGNTAYEVTTTVTDAGGLPTKCLFVLSIVDPADPKADVLGRIVTPRDIRRIDASLYIRVDSTGLLYISGDPFLRIASVSDLTLIDRDRAEAVRYGRAEYLASAVTLLYTDNVTADAAYRQIIERLSALVVAWGTFSTAFETRPTEGYDLPSPDASIEALRTSVYNAAVNVRKAYEASLLAAQSAFDLSFSGCSTNRAIYAMLVADVASLERARVRMLAIVEVGTTHAQDFALQQGPYTGDVDSYEAVLVSKRVSLRTYADSVQACQAATSQRRVERDAAQADVARALDDERRALADVRAICPTFTPTE